MNINAYKEYRFSQGILTAPKTGNTYQFFISRNDRFYNYMKEHIVNEKVDGLTNGSLTLCLPLDFHNPLHYSPLRLIFLSNFCFFLCTLLYSCGIIDIYLYFL